MTDSPFNLTAKINRNKFLQSLIFSAIPIVGLIYGIIKNTNEEMEVFHKSPIGLSILISFMLFSFVFFFYIYLFDKKAKLIIDKDGIWTPKFGQVKWQSVWYIYQKERRGRFTQHTLIIKLKEEDKEIKIDTTDFDKTETEIIIALKECASKFNVQFLDKEIQKVY